MTRPTIEPVEHRRPGPTRALAALFGTATFRLTIGSTTILLLVTLLQFSLIYWRITQYEVERADRLLDREATLMAAQPPSDLLDQLRLWQTNDLRLLITAAGLFDADRHPLGGNLTQWPENLPVDGAIREITVHPLDQGPRTVRAEALPVQGGRFLVIGRGLRDLQQLREITLEAIETALIPALLFSLGAGAWLGRRTLARVGRMQRTIDAIMEGGLHERLPVGRSGDEMARLAASVNRMLHRLEHLLDEIRGVGDDIAHDLRTPLARVRAGLDRARLDRLRLDHSDPDHPDPGQAGADRVRPDRDGPRHPEPDRADLERADLDPIGPDHSTPGYPTPGYPTLGHADPDHPNLDRARLDRIRPNHPIPPRSDPDSAAPDRTAASPAEAGTRKPDALLGAVNRAIVDLDQCFAIVTALLRIGEIETGRRRGGFARVSLDQLLADIVELYEPVAEEAGHRLEIEPSAAHVWINGDRDLLIELVANLVDNAIKFTPTGGRITLSASQAPPWIAHRTDRRALLRVADTGIGIPDAERDLVLKRFFRSDKSRHIDGSGLGLSLVAAIAGLHDATIAVRDGPTGGGTAIGTTFELAFHELLDGS